MALQSCIQKWQCWGFGKGHLHYSLYTGSKSTQYFFNFLNLGIVWYFPIAWKSHIKIWKNVLQIVHLINTRWHLIILLKYERYFIEVESEKFLKLTLHTKWFSTIIQSYPLNLNFCLRHPNETSSLENFQYSYLWLFW